MMNSELQGKVALVTGASRGIGKSIALELAAAGYDLLLTARDSAALDGVAAVVRATGRRSEIHAADLRGEGEPARLASLARERFGRLDVLINNAGASRRGSFFEQTEAEWQDGFALKFFAQVRLCRAAWPLLKAAQGSVVAIGAGSAAAVVPPGLAESEVPPPPQPASRAVTRSITMAIPSRRITRARLATAAAPADQG